MRYIFLQSVLSFSKAKNNVDNRVKYSMFRGKDNESVTTEKQNNAFSFLLCFVQEQYELIYRVLQTYLDVDVVYANL